MPQKAAVSPQQPSSEDLFWTSLEVAQRLKLLDNDGLPSVAAVHNAVYRDKSFPRPKKIRGKNRFVPSEIIAWANSQPATDGRSSTPAQAKRGRKPKAAIGGGQ